MPWARIDDAIMTHRKFLVRSEPAKLICLSAIVYCNRELTDGKLTESDLRVLFATAGPVALELRPEITQELISVALWDIRDGEIWVHDFLDYNKPREQVLAERELVKQQRSEAGKRSAEVRLERYGTAQPSNKSNTLPNGVFERAPNEPSNELSNELSNRAPNELSNPIPIPIPIPNPNTNTQKDKENVRNFDHFWSHYPRKENKKRAWEWWNAHHPDVQMLTLIADGLKAAKKSKQWNDPQYIPHAVVWLRGERWNDVYSPNGTDPAAIERWKAKGWIKDDEPGQ